MTPQQFIAKWQRANLSERSACQQHFCDLCDVLGQPKPAEADPDGEWYTFEYGVKKLGGGDGWADVWMKGHFGWEYKGKRKNLEDAYAQLSLYREALENPYLLIVCDMDRFEVHTNFPNTVKRIYAFDLAGLAEPANLAVLQKAFTDPEALRPEATPQKITEEAAERFGELAERLRIRGVPAEQAAHFLMKLMFCMFGEDIGLLPKDLLTRLVETAKANPVVLPRRLESLFKAMAVGGDFGADAILRFNGGLFADSDTILLKREEINILASICRHDWANVEPSIFGTLFERTLDPSKRAQIGAHYTSREDIETLLQPVLMAPLRREWDEVRAKCEGTLWPAVKEAAGNGGGHGKRKGKGSKGSAERRRFDRQIQSFTERLAHVTVLDPACGSGNFLYVAINMLLDLEKEVIAYAAARGLTLLPHVRPTQLHGLEINPYAQQLAQVAIWIGYLQWIHQNGFKTPSDPVLEPIESIRCTDAILDLSDPKAPIEPEWPAAEFIVSNPPFLGGKLLRANLGDEYVDAIFRVWDDRVPREADLCCYWFEKARQQIEAARCQRAGLLATQGIRRGANRKVLERIKQTGDIFFAESDRDWILDGANVHVSMVGFDDGTDEQRVLDSCTVAQITAQLRGDIALEVAASLGGNAGLSFMGITPAGPFDINFEIARGFLEAPNVSARPNSDVVRPYLNGKDLNQRPRDQWTVDFGTDMPAEAAAKYELPFEHITRHVKLVRVKNKRESYRERWWIYAESRPAMREAFRQHERYLATCMVAKHRLYVWLPAVALPANVVIVFARSDDFLFGLLHSRVHETWARAQGSQLREVESGFRYTPTSCFETFPFPEPTASQEAAIAAAAKELDELRSAWLNPPEWTKTEILEFPGSVDGPWARWVSDPDARGIGTVRWPRLVPKDPDCAASLKSRTLTNLYNERPAWLANAHRKLDEAVFAAYGWDPGIPDETLLEKLLKLNLERAAG